MKKLIFASFLFLGLALSGFSQPQPQHQKKSPEERAKMITDALTKKLSLTDKQQKEIYQIQLDRAKEMEKLHDEAMKKLKKDLDRRKQLADASDEKVNKVLTDQQKTLYADMKAKQEARFKDRKQGHRKDLNRKRGEE